MDFAQKLESRQYPTVHDEYYQLSQSNDFNNVNRSWRQGRRFTHRASLRKGHLCEAAVRLRRLAGGIKPHPGVHAIQVAGGRNSQCENKGSIALARDATIVA